MSAEREQSGCCIYCGRWIVGERTCAEHRSLERADPLAGLMRGRLSERELGLELPWPEVEPTDDGSEE